MGIIDDNTVAQIAALHHKHLYFLAVVVVGLGLIKELGEFGTGDDAPACRVKIYANNIAAAGLHIYTLLAEGHQQVLGCQAPVQECAHLVYCLDAHEGEVTHNGLGHLGCGHRAVLAVVIDKHADDVAHLHLRGEVSLGQQHLMGVVVNQIGSEVDGAVDAQLIIFSNFHSLSIIDLGPSHGMAATISAKILKNPFLDLLFLKFVLP